MASFRFDFAYGDSKTSDRLFKNTKGQPILMVESPKALIASTAGKLQVLFTTDSAYKKILKVRFYGSTFRMVNTGNILEQKYELVPDIKTDFECNAIPARDN